MKKKLGFASAQPIWLGAAGIGNRFSSQRPLQFIASSARYPEFRCLNAHQRNRVLKKKLGFSSAQPIWLGAAGIGNRFSSQRPLQFIASSARYPEFRCLNAHQRNRVLKKKLGFSSAQPIWLGAAGIGNRFSLPRLLQFIAWSARFREFKCLNVLRRNRVLKKKLGFASAQPIWLGAAVIGNRFSSRRLLQFIAWSAR